MKGAILPLVGLGLCCGGHLVSPLLLAAGPVALLGVLAGALPLVLVVAAAVVLCVPLGAARVRRRRVRAVPSEPLAAVR